jgi:arginine exporter protein ArgO
MLAFDVIHNLAYRFGGGTFLGLFGSVQCILGVGMLLHQLWAQFIMKWVCILSLFWYGLVVLKDLMLASDPRIGWVPFLTSSFSLALVGLTLYLLYTEADV